MLANTIANRSLEAWWPLLALLTALLTLLSGRACAVGSARWARSATCSRSGDHQRNKIPEAWRSIKYSLLAAVLAAAIVANLTLLIFDPLNLLIRSFSSSLLPALDTAITAMEKAFFTIPVLQEPWSNLTARSDRYCCHKARRLPGWRGVCTGVFRCAGLNFFAPDSGAGISARWAPYWD